MAQLGQTPSPDGLEHLQKHELRQKGVGTLRWEIEGRVLNKEQVVELACEKILEDPEDDIVDICQRPGWPSVGTFFNWLRANRSFAEAWERAEGVRAMILVNQARKTSRRAMGGSMPDVVAAKNYADGLRWEAGKINNRFADKQIIEEKREIQLMSEGQLVERLVAAIMAKPEVLGKMRHLMPEGVATEVDRQMAERERLVGEAEAMDAELVPDGG